MKVFITGNLGYIGSVLTDILLEKKIDFIGYDIGYFKNCNLLNTNLNFKQVIKDIRDIEKKDLEDTDCIVHLAALSNDPLGELDANLTYEINYVSTVKLANIAKESGVKRFIYISTQSIYGISNTDDELDEYGSIKNPVTEYARTKWKAEIELDKLNSKDFSVVIFRPSTVYGVSPRLRCDIVFNNLVGSAYSAGKIEIKSDGSPWRPVVHVRDVCSAILAGLQAPNKLIAGKVFNIGTINGNYTIKDLAEVVRKLIPNAELFYSGEHLKDSRTYKVSFTRILTELKDHYIPEWNLEKGGVELINFFNQINFNTIHFKGIYTNRLICLSNLITNKIVNNQLKFI